MISRSLVHRPCLSLALLLLVPACTAAQSGVNHKVSLGLGVGYGTGNLLCDCGSTGGQGGSAFSLHAVERVSPVVGLGIEANAWTKSNLFLWQLSLAVYDYVEPNSSFFLKGGVGLAQYHLGGATTHSSTGFGVMGGLGYIDNIGRTSSLGPVATVRYGFLGHVDEGLFGTHALTDLVFDVGLVLRFGWE